MDDLTKATLLGMAPSVAYLMAIVLVGVLLFVRSCSSEPPAAVATQHLDRNHRLTSTDIETSTTAPLIGRILQKEVQKGEAITPAMVGQKAVPATFTPGLAALIPVPTLALRTENIVAGTDVKVCVKMHLLAGPTKVLRIEDCDDKVCWVLIGLSRTDAMGLDPVDLADARLVPRALTCSTHP